MNKEAVIAFIISTLMTIVLGYTFVQTFMQRKLINELVLFADQAGEYINTSKELSEAVVRYNMGVVEYNKEVEGKKQLQQAP